MTTTLARHHNVTEGGIEEVSLALKDAIESENEDQLETALGRLAQRPRAVAWLLPSAYDKAAKKVNLQRLRALAAHKADMFGAYTETRLEIAREQADVLLKAVGTHYQTELAKFAESKMDEITVTILASRSKFIRQFVPALEEAESLRDRQPELYESVMTSLNQQRSVYFETLGTLLGGFVSKLDSRINQDT